MSHLGSYKWFRRTQYIPELDVDYNVWGFYLRLICKMVYIGDTFFVNLVSLFQVREVVTLGQTLIEILDITEEYFCKEVVVDVEVVSLHPDHTTSQIF